MEGNLFHGEAILRMKQTTRKEGKEGIAFGIVKKVSQDNPRRGKGGGKGEEQDKKEKSLSLRAAGR